MPLFPEIPPDAKQTNCWRFILMIYLVCGLLNIITYAAVGLWSQLFGFIIEIFIYLAIMYHIAYVEIDVTEQRIEVSMGPLKWWGCRWFCSSQVSKEEIVLIERKQRQCLYDVCPRFYCSPINWCCCHKSYSAYWWPCCCNNSDMNICNLCEGDSDSSEMIQINLTRDTTEFSTMCCKRCSPCPFPWSLCFCCVYNRIAVSIKNEQVFQTLESFGYPLQTSEENERTQLAPGYTPGANEGITEGATEGKTAV